MTVNKAKDAFNLYLCPCPVQCFIKQFAFFCNHESTTAMQTFTILQCFVPLLSVRVPHLKGRYYDVTQTGYKLITIGSSEWSHKMQHSSEAGSVPTAFQPR